MKSDTRKREKKKIGDATSITIPREYHDWFSGEKMTVNNKKLKIINEALGKRGFVHLVMTGIALVEEKMEEEEGLKLNEKVDKMYSSVNTIETLLRGLYEAKVGN